MKLSVPLSAGSAMLAMVVLAACASPDGSEAGSSASGAGSAGASLTLVTGTKGSPFYEAMACGAQAAAAEHDVSLTVSAPDTWGAAEQLPVLDSVAAQNPDALLVVPTDVEALTDRLAGIAEDGTPIVELDQRITDESISVSRIASSDEEGGREAARTLADLIGGSGKVLAVSSPPGTDAQYIRVDAFVAELEENYPDIEVLGPLFALNDVTAAAGHVTSTLASDPDLAGVFVANDVNAIGVVTGLEEAGAVGTVQVVAYDAAETEVQALRDGSVQALIAQDPYGEGYQGVEQALLALDGEDTEPEIMIPLTVLTADDPDGLDAYLERNGSC